MEMKINVPQNSELRTNKIELHKFKWKICSYAQKRFSPVVFGYGGNVCQSV